jgi:hypothetical protein
MDETQSYIIVWADTGGKGLAGTLVYHDLPSDDPRYVYPEFTPVRTYTQDQLRSTDVIVTDAAEARLMIKRTSPPYPMAIPVSVAKELNWFPKARYFGFETVLSRKERGKEGCDGHGNRRRHTSGSRTGRRPAGRRRPQMASVPVPILRETARSD